MYIILKNKRKKIITSLKMLLLLSTRNMIWIWLKEFIFMLMAATG